MNTESPRPFATLPLLRGSRMALPGEWISVLWFDSWMIHDKGSQWIAMRICLPVILKAYKGHLFPGFLVWLVACEYLHVYTLWNISLCHVSLPQIFLKPKTNWYGYIWRWRNMYIQIGIYRGIRLSIIKLRRVGKCQASLSDHHNLPFTMIT